MERIIAFIGLFIFSFFPTSGQGIVFYEGDWSDAISLSNKENKYLFIEVYGDWCSACRNMEKNVFTLPEVGELYNNYFVNVRLNGDDPENDALIDQWKISAYPSLLIANFNGSEITRITGFTNAFDFIRFGTDAVQYSAEIAGFGQNPDLQTLKSFLLNYAHLSESTKNPYLEYYFGKKVVATLSQKEDIQILNSSITVASPGMIEFLYIFYSNKENGLQYSQALKKLDSRLQEMAHSSIDLNDVLKYQNFRLKLSNIYKSEYPILRQEIEYQKEDDLLNLYKIEKNITDYRQLATKIMEDRFMPLSPSQINRIDGYLNQQLTPNNPRKKAHITIDYVNDLCLAYYRLFDEKDDLISALQWIRKSITIIPSARAYLIATGLSNKIEKHSQAKSYLEKAKLQKDYKEQTYLFEELISAYDVK